MSFISYINEQSPNDVYQEIVNKKFEPYLKEIPKKYTFKIDGNYLRIFNDKKEINSISVNVLNKERFETMIKSLDKVTGTPKTTFKNLGNLDWDKHGDGH